MTLGELFIPLLKIENVILPILVCLAFIIFRFTCLCVFFVQAFTPVPGMMPFPMELLKYFLFNFNLNTQKTGMQMMHSQTEALFEMLCKP